MQNLPKDVNSPMTIKLALNHSCMRYRKRDRSSRTRILISPSPDGQHMEPPGRSSWAMDERDGMQVLGVQAQVQAAMLLVRNSQPCTRDDEEFSGGCNLVYRIAFEDGTRCAFRVSYDEFAPPVECTVTTLRYVRSTVPSIPIATVHAWSDSADGDGVGTPYMLLDWIEGNLLGWSASYPATLGDRDKILAQLARYSVSLLERTSETISPGSPPSVLAWMLKRIDDRLVRIFTGDLPAFDAIDCLIYRAMAEEKYHMPALDALPFPLIHTDLSKMNVLVDYGFNITEYTIFLISNGLWRLDEYVLQDLRLGRMGLSPSSTMRSDVPAIIAVDPGPLYDSALFHDDRLVFINHFASAIASSISSGLRDPDLHLQSILADDELEIFHASIKSKGVYTLWVSKYAVQDARWVTAARKALDQFVLARPQMASLSAVLAVRDKLQGMLERGGASL